LTYITVGNNKSVSGLACAPAQADRNRKELNEIWILVCRQAGKKFDAYRVAIEYVSWAYHFCEALKGQRNAKDQLRRELVACRVCRSALKSDNTGIGMATFPLKR
jgi:hypothetical protein